MIEQTDTVPAVVDTLSARRACCLLALAIVAGIVARLAYLNAAMAAPGFEWTDPDYYLFKSHALFDANGHWRWTAEAVQYRHRGRLFHLPPLYSLFLSLFGFTPWPLAQAAAVAQALLPTVTSIAAYALGATLHSRRAGLVAGMFLALCPAFLTSAPVFVQEQIYIPLLMASLAMLAWLVAAKRRAAWWAATGALFGLAALTRSMPLYYLPPALGLAVWMAPDRRALTRGLLPLAAGFVAVTLPYSVMLSLSLGRWVFIEDHASISLVAYTRIISTKPPSLFSELGLLINAVATEPVRVLTTFGDYVSAAFKLSGRRWVDLSFPLATGGWRTLLNLYAAVFADLAFAAGVVLGPFGVILARCQGVARVLAIWPPIVILLTAIAAYGGPRYRLPFEVVVYVFAAVVVAGEWRRPARLLTAVAALLSAVTFLALR